MSTPHVVGSIINIEWLARQMRLPVEEVRAKIEQAERRDRGEEFTPVRQA